MKRYSNLGDRMADLGARLEQSLARPAIRRSGDLPRRDRIQKHVRLDASQRHELVALYVDGATTNGLARQFDVHKDTVRAVLDSAGVRRKQRRRMTEADVCEAEQLRAQGTSLAAVGRRFGVSPETVRRRLGKDQSS